MTWATWLLAAILTTSTEQTLNRRFISTTGRPWDYLLGYNLGAVAFLALFARPESVAILPGDLGLLVISGVFWFLACIFSFKADEYAEVTITSLVGQSQFVFVALGGFLLFGEPLLASRLIGIVLILLGIGIRIPGNLKLGLTANRGVTYKFIMVFAMAAAILIDKSLTKTVSAETITLFGFALPLTIAVGIRFRHLGAAIELARGLRLANLGMGALGCFSYYALIRAITDAPLSLAFPLYQLNLLVTLALGYFVLKEYDRPRTKMAAALLVVAGSVVLRW